MFQTEMAKCTGLVETDLSWDAWMARLAKHLTCDFGSGPDLMGPKTKSHLWLPNPPP